MQKRSTTKQIQQAIKNNLLKLVKAEKYSKSTHKTTTISTDTFKDDLDFLCETIFADCVGWHYELNHETGNYEVETGRMDGDSDFIFIAHLCACDGVKVESVDKILNVIEEE
jgi:hypothetical protein